MVEPVQRLRNKARKTLAALGLAAAVALGAGTWGVYDIHVRHRLGTVAPGIVYKSGTMPPARMAKVAKELGLKSVIDLRTSVEGQDSTNTTPLVAIKAEAAALEAEGVRHIHLPTPQVPSEATVDQFLRVVADPANLPTLIHCYHGIGRTELFVAVYRMEFQGWSNAKARAATRLILAGSSFSDQAEKGIFLINYKPRLKEVLAAGPQPPSEPLRAR
jgi:protein-tyrosine phosphatase